MLKMDEAIKKLEAIGFQIVPDKVRISIPQPRENLWAGISYFIGEGAQWLPEYEGIAAWLQDNKERGLLCLGNCGRGKSLICNRVLPVLLNHFCHKVLSCYDAQQMNTDIDDVMRKHIVYIDDIGTEGMSIKFGERRMAFPELVDDAEKKGKLLIVTSNLTTDELKEKYGERTVDRLRGISKLVLFKGKSLRQ